MGRRIREDKLYIKLCALLSALHRSNAAVVEAKAFVKLDHRVPMVQVFVGGKTIPLRKSYEGGFIYDWNPRSLAVLHTQIKLASLRVKEEMDARINEQIAFKKQMAKAYGAAHI